ncbi:MAG TPA: FCD domain-containing protein [Solirubrobacterales bacterium]|nr:FCD domain-containing protein [Solirubrobacterales bacterium]
MSEDQVTRDRRAVEFAPIEPLRAHEYVAEQIRRHIGLGLIGVGESLPPERDLAKMFGVGRATIQAALRLLEADHLIESRRGRGGGTFVIEPAQNEAAQARSKLELHLSRAEIEDALQFRRVVEEGTVRLAAESATAEDLAVLRSLSEQMADTDSEREFHRLDTEFHVAIALASHNELLRNATEQSRLILNEAIIAQPETDVWHERICREHDALIRAIDQGDHRRAVRAMRTHLSHTEKGITALLAALG